MKKMNNKGYTLVEMMTVIAIITMIAGVSLAGVSHAYTKAKENYIRIAAQNEYSFENEARQEIKAYCYPTVNNVDIDEGVVPGVNTNGNGGSYNNGNNGNNGNHNGWVQGNGNNGNNQNASNQHGVENGLVPDPNATTTTAAPTTTTTAAPTTTTTTTTTITTTAAPTTAATTQAQASGNASAVAGNPNTWNGGGNVAINSISAPAGTSKVTVVVEFDSAPSSAGGWTASSYEIVGNTIVATININNSNQWIINGGSMGVQWSGSASSVVSVTVTAE